MCQSSTRPSGETAGALAWVNAASGCGLSCSRQGSSTAVSVGDGSRGSGGRAAGTANRSASRPSSWRTDSSPNRNVPEAACAATRAWAAAVLPKRASRLAAALSVRPAASTAPETRVTPRASSPRTSSRPIAGPSTRICRLLRAACGTTFSGSAVRAASRPSRVKGMTSSRTRKTSRVGPAIRARTGGGVGVSLPRVASRGSAGRGGFSVNDPGVSTSMPVLTSKNASSCRCWPPNSTLIRPILALSARRSTRPSGLSRRTRPRKASRRFIRSAVRNRVTRGRVSGSASCWMGNSSR